jgi:quercetin dioxygenase-like cupin family protein
VGSARVKKFSMVDHEGTKARRVDHEGTKARPRRHEGTKVRRVDHEDTKVRRVEGSGGVVVYLVQFDPGARTNWHRHSGPQLLLVQKGQGLVQKWGEAARAIGPGDAVTIEPHEKHWHGAAAGASMTHFAVNLDFTTEWLEPVSDDQYRAS